MMISSHYSNRFNNEAPRFSGRVLPGFCMVAGAVLMAMPLVQTGNAFKVANAARQDQFARAAQGELGGGSSTNTAVVTAVRTGYNGTVPFLAGGALMLGGFFFRKNGFFFRKKQ